MLLLSIGIDLGAVLATRLSITTGPSANTAIPLPGPRRYPPAYRAGALAWLDDTAAVRHKTVIKN